MTKATISTMMILMSLGLSMNTMAFTPDMTEVDGRSVPSIEWKTTLNKFRFDGEKFLGQRFTAMCPRSSQKARTDKMASHAIDYSICQAGLDAGAIDNKGGLVTVQVNPGGSVHAGSGSATHARSLSVVGQTNAKDTDKIYRDHIPLIKWDTKFTRTNMASQHLIGQRSSFECPKAPSNKKGWRVVGTDAYAFNSLICRAAVHAGAITNDGGIVTIQLNPGKKKLVGSVQNGIESKGGSSGLGALTFVDNPITH